MSTFDYFTRKDSTCQSLCHKTPSEAPDSTLQAKRYKATH